jgi:hypothetical protein
MIVRNELSHIGFLSIFDALTVLVQVNSYMCKRNKVAQLGNMRLLFVSANVSDSIFAIHSVNHLEILNNAVLYEIYQRK